jgi:hypothetical protein
MTSAKPKLRPAKLCFSVGRTEDWASLSVTYGDQTLDLGPQFHNHCLVTLARRRVVDAAAGMRTSQQGWLSCDALCVMLDLEPSELDVLVCRAHHQWRSELPALGDLIERRPDALRLASLPFEIKRGSIPEVHYSFA